MAPPPIAEPDDDDPLESLHRMSRTAGVGTQEYVAVNATAVVALILGLLSSAAVMSDVLLVIPVATVIVSLVAIVQVKNSGGTQTGKGFAGAGLVLALVFVGWVGGQALIKQGAIAAAKGEILSLVDQLSKSVTSHDYEAAWKLFGEHFRGQVWKKDFISTWQMLQGLEGYGPIKGITWNTRLVIEIDPETDVRLGSGILIIDTSGGEPDRWRASFRYYTDRGWLIEDVENQFFPKHEIVPEEKKPIPLLPVE